jgi:hypothetical protein
MTSRTPGPRGVSDATVRKNTGRSWAEWFAILDAWDAPSQGHTRSARHLVEMHGVSGWWAQTVTVRYEWERGLRYETVVPDDLRAALDACHTASAHVEQLTDTHRREYVEWIEEATKPEKRTRRIAGTVERLAAAPAGAASSGPR